MHSHKYIFINKEEDFIKSMKKIYYLLGLSLGLVSMNVSAQKTDDATVNVRLYPIQTIVVNGSQKIVNLDYKTSADYKNGVALDEADHLTVYSTGAFAVNVQSRDAQLSSVNTSITEKINAADIKITPTAGTTNPLSGSKLSTVNLSTTPTELISSNIGGVDKTFNVKYSAAGADSYLNKYFNVENPTTYTTVVTYTIVAK
ncbi:hypothetical protein L100_10649 [Elizabethkingia meningoseptica ATCC 13253 = NBRC 12535]|nr:hypothetical protein L100_10649 [Elizabethkingia meningoseptica ATCC 13253 = NBRC 12535]